MSEKIYDIAKNETLADKLESAKLALEEAKKEEANVQISFAEKKKAILEQIQARTTHLENTKADKIARQDSMPGIPTSPKNPAQQAKTNNMIGRLKKAGATNIVKVENLQAAEGIASSAAEIVLNQPTIKKLEKPAEPAIVATKVETVTAPEQLQKTKEIKQEKSDFEQLSETYAKNGFGEVVGKLALLPDFAALSEGQKLLVMQGVSDRFYEHIETSALHKFQDEQAKSGFWGRAWKGARKNYLTAKHRKSVLAEAGGAGSEAFVASIAPELIQVFKESGLSSYLSTDKKTVITAYSLFENHVNPSGQGEFEYNYAASQLARIPDDWNKPGAKKSEKAAYREAEQNFKIAKDEYLSRLVIGAREQKIQNPEAYAAEIGSLSETTVRMMRLLSSNPEAFKRIGVISKNPAWLSGVKDTLFERTLGTTAGLASTSGRVTRGLITLSAGVGSTLSLAAMPVIAAVVGGFRGNARAKESLRQSDKLARVGVVQEGATTNRMSSVDRKIRQLSDTKKFIESTTNYEERKQALARLKTYSDFIEAKLELGQVNFGDEKGRFSRQYELMRSLHEAHVQIATTSFESDIFNVFSKDEMKDSLMKNDALRGRVASFGAIASAKTATARENEIQLATIKGIAFGALAGTAGAMARHFTDLIGNWYHHRLHASLHTNLHTNPTTATLAAAKAAKKEMIQNVRSASAYNHPIPHGGETLNEKLFPHQTNLLGHHGTGASEASKNLFHPEHPNLTKLGIVDHPIDVDHAVAKVSFSLEGAGKTLLDFRHSDAFKNLPLEQQEFFKGNIYKIAEKLKEFRPTAIDGKESLSVGPGSQFGVTPDGKVFITDTLHGGNPKVLGHFEGGNFKTDEPEGLHYIHAGAHEKSTTMSVGEKGTLTDTTPSSDADKLAPEGAVVSGKVSKETLESLGLRSQQEVADQYQADPYPDNDIYPNRHGAEYFNEDYNRQLAISGLQSNQELNQHLGDLDDQYVSYNDPNDYSVEDHITEHQLRHSERLATRLVRHQINRYFSYFDPFGQKMLGMGSPVWYSYSYKPASSVMSENILNYQPSFRPFVRHLRELALKYPEVNRNQPLKNFMAEAYLYKAEDKVAGTHVAAE
jgi:hypothetical protein